MDFTSKNLTIPRGKMLFAEYLNGTRMPGAARWLGNCPEFTMSVTANDLDHYSSTRGTRNLDASITLGNDWSGAVSTDDYDAENVRYFFMATKRAVAVTAQTAQTYTITAARKGGIYQVGRTEANPLGVGKLTTVAVAVASTTMQEFVDYEVDYDSGLIQILPNGAINDEANAVVTYSTAQHTYQELSAGEKAIEGELRFISENPYGPNRRLVIPRARISPQGDMSFLTDGESPAWGTISLAIRAMKKGNLPMILNAEGLPAVGVAGGM